MMFTKAARSVAAVVSSKALPDGASGAGVGVAGCDEVCSARGAEGVAAFSEVVVATTLPATLFLSVVTTFWPKSIRGRITEGSVTMGKGGVVEAIMGVVAAGLIEIELVSVTNRPMKKPMMMSTAGTKNGMVCIR